MTSPTAQHYKMAISDYQRTFTPHVTLMFYRNGKAYTRSINAGTWLRRRAQQLANAGDQRDGKER